MYNSFLINYKHDKAISKYLFKKLKIDRDRYTYLLDHD